MKKILLIVGGLFVVLIAAAIIIPIVFKDDIKAEIDKVIAQQVNADVNFSADDFGLSLFSDFPNVSAELNNFSIVGKEPFKGDTLTSIKSFQVSIDLMSVLFGDEMKIDDK